ncbi:MAG: glycosyltransferase [Nitrospirae bacterium]|nr:glycosyltransferase [Nitrospirota bacterium]
MRILWLKTDLLHPVDVGSKIRTYYMLRELKRKHEVTYLTLDDGAAGPEAYRRADEYCHELIHVPHTTTKKFSWSFYCDLAKNVLSGRPYAIDKYRSADFTDTIGRLIRTKRIELVVCDFLHPSINLPSALACPMVLFQHNVEAMILRRQFEVQTQPITRAYFRQQWRKMREYERDACRRFDYVVAVSENDRDVMAREYGLTQIGSIPTGVDTTYFRSSGCIKAEPAHLVFTGSMDWQPNDDGMWFFVKEVLPLIRLKLPNVKLTIVGRKPFPRMEALNRQDPSIRITGRVEDVRPYMEQASAYVVPLRIGGGTRLKIFEAMAMEKAIVSTSIGAEGLPITDGLDILIADTPQAFAAAVLRVLNDQSLAKRLGDNAAAMVRNEYAWDRVADSFVNLCERACRSSLRATA